MPRNRDEIIAKSVNYNGLKEIKNLLKEFEINARITGPHIEEQKKCLRCHRRSSINKSKCSFCGSTDFKKVKRKFYLLRIGGYVDVKRFYENIGFKLKRKQNRLKDNLKIIPKFLRKK